MENNHSSQFRLSTIKAGRIAYGEQVMENYGKQWKTLKKLLAKLFGKKKLPITHFYSIDR